MWTKIEIRREMKSRSETKAIQYHLFEIDAYSLDLVMEQSVPLSDGTKFAGHAQFLAARSASNTLQCSPSGVPAGFTYRQGQRGAKLPHYKIKIEEHLCDDTKK